VQVVFRTGGRLEQSAETGDLRFVAGFFGGEGGVQFEGFVQFAAEGVQGRGGQGCVLVGDLEAL